MTEEQLYMEEYIKNVEKRIGNLKESHQHHVEQAIILERDIEGLQGILRRLIND